MTKKGTFKMNRIALFALAMVLSMSLVLPVFATPGEKVSLGTEENPAKAALTKIFQMPENTDTPDIEFEFTFEPIAFDDSDDPDDMAKFPAEDLDITVEFSNSSISITDEDIGVKTLMIQEEIFKDVDWKHEGKYEFLVKETQNTYNITDEFEEKMIYSQGQYGVEVYIMEGKDGKLFVFAILAKIVVHDESNKDENIGDKVIVDPGTDKELTIEGDHSRMIFTNIYVKNNGTPEITDPEDPDPEEIDEFSTLKITKKVDDKGDKTQSFNFRATVDLPAVGDLEDDWDSYTAYKVGKDAANNIHIEEIIFTVGDEKTFTLKHGEYLAFTDMHVGASFIAQEDGIQNFTPDYIIVKNGNSEAKVIGDKGKLLSTGLKRIGESDNRADYTNTQGMVTPTGISVDNLPYIVLIMASVFALAGYIAIKFRLKGKSNA